MNTKILPLLFIAALIAGQTLFSQEKWSVDPRSTQLYPSGQYVPLPQVDNFQNPNHESRLVRTPQGIFLVNPNFRVHPDPGATQSEVILTRNQQIPNVMFGSANTVWPPGGFSGISEGVYVTTDGGVTWFGYDTVHSTPITGHGGDPGVAIDRFNTLIISHLGYPTSGMFANYSTDYGVTFSPTYTIATGSQDKNLSGTDDAPASAFYGRTYTVWSWFSVAAPYVAISYTTNSGVSWSSPAQVNSPPGGHYSQGVDIRVGNSGQVYVTWAAPISSFPYTEDFDGFAVSTNGGVSFTVTENAFDANGIRGNLSTKGNIRVNSFPRIDVDRSGGPRNGWIYIVGCDKNLAPAGSDPDIILHRSTDGGVTWSSGIRVNQDPLNNGAIQYFPAIRVDEYGGVNVVYYDDRNVGSNLVQVFVSRSIDGGSTWTDLQVSDHSFAPAPISGLASGYQGDYIGITSANNKVWPFWMDNSSGIYQAWTTTVDLGPSIAHTPLSNTENLTGPYPVNCVITPAGSAIDPTKTKLYWSRNNPSITDSVLMTNTSGNNWTANIPGNGSSATYRYYIKTADLLGRIATAPAGAPANLYSFLAQISTTPPSITSTPLPNWPKASWPATVTANVTDQIGIDSSWVEWNINHGAGKEFKLLHTTGSTYTAAFNSVQSDVNIGDSIFYVIKARSSGQNHLVGVLPATGSYGFRIINVVLCETFEGASFPPAGWTITGGTANYWKQGSVSAFGQGAKSAYYNMWTAPNGENENFNTLTFGATGSNDTLVYDYAFAPYPASPPYAQDSLIIMASTDNGTTYTSIARYGPLQDSTHIALNSEFTPSPADWRIRRLLLPPGTNKIDFFGKSAFGNDLYIDNACISSGTITAITSNNNNLPFTYSLSQNFPNPFNPSTVIKYSIPKAGIVKMVVYDILGRQIAVLVNELKQPGNYEVKFDASNFASGVYFYKIEAGNFTSVKKMLLLK